MIHLRLQAALGLLGAGATLTAILFAQVMFGPLTVWKWTWSQVGERAVYALYFALQTMTTVGYGNWLPPGMTEADPKVFWVKVISLPAMVAGAALFTAAIGAAISITRPVQPVSVTRPTRS